jgi:hypothetical protein
MAIDLDDPIALMLEDARSVVDKQRARLDRPLLETEIAQLTNELTDHDIRGRFELVMK